MRGLDRAYQAFVRCHGVVAGARTEEELFRSFCNVAVHGLGFRLAWVGLTQAGDERVHPVAQAGFEAGYLEALHVTCADDDHGRGPTGRAIREHLPAVAQDIATDPSFAPWRKDALARGYGSSAAIPICVGAECIGALNLYATEPNAFDDDEIALLEEVAVDLALGVVRLRNERLLEQMEVLAARAARAETASRVAAALAHDVNNLLQIVSLSISGAQEAGDAGESTEDLANAERATRSAASLMRQFLSLTRRTLDGAESIEVDPVVSSLRSLLTRLVPNVSLEVRLGAAGLRACIGRHALERILINLVVNAGHAMAAGGALSVSTARRCIAEEGAQISSGRLPSGRYVELSVTDTGAGISDEILPRIFEPHFTTKGDEGTGLGLYSVLEIAKKAGGGVSIESEVGRGTRVTVFVPLASAVAPSTA